MRIAIAVLLAVCAVGCGDDGNAADAGPSDAAPTGGTLTLSWTIADGGAPLDCEDVAGVSVRVTATPVGGGSAAIESFTCTSGNGTSNPIPPGRYNVAIDLRASGNRSLIAAAITMNDIDVALDQDTSLGSVEFEVTPVGSFTFSIAADGVATNCTDAEITQVELSLADEDGNCVPATFAIGADTYDSTCPAGAAFNDCIERDQTITVASTPSGTHNLAVVGQKAGNLDCWLRTTQFTIPGNNLDTDLALLALTLDPNPDCQ